MTASLRPIRFWESFSGNQQARGLEGNENWQALVRDWFPEQATKCPVDRSPLGIRWRVSSKTPGNSLEGISEVWVGLRLTTTQLGRATVKSWGRALSAGPLLNEITSWEVNGQPAL